MQNIMHIYVLKDTLNTSFKILIASVINWRVIWALAFSYFFIFREAADASSYELLSEGRSEILISSIYLGFLLKF
jgi:hypothetical protein